MRQQFVEINQNKLMSSGAPQGSALGLQIFIVYINNACQVSEILNLVLFADSILEVVNKLMKKLEHRFEINCF